MKNWLMTFLTEKSINLDETFEINVNNVSNFFTYEVIVELILSSSPSEQKMIKETLIKIDFKNGDVKHYLRFLGECASKTQMAA